MFRNFIVLAYRHFVRSPLTSFIELMGMTAGITVFLLILLWANNEFSMDDIEEADNIFRLEVNSNRGTGTGHGNIVGKLLAENFAEVDAVTRIRFMEQNHQVAKLNPDGSKSMYDAGQRIFADSSIFEMFGFEFIHGSKKNALKHESAVVITESLANTIFNTTDVVGEKLDDLEVLGVIKDPVNFHIPIKIIRPFNRLKKIYSTSLGHDRFENWVYNWHPTYLKLKSGDIKALEGAFTSFLEAERPEPFKANEPIYTYQLRKLKDIYFSKKVEEKGLIIHGDKQKTLIYISTAILTLLLSCINFVNLISAQSLERSKEIGIKKVTGASRAQIFLQFYGEVLLTCCIAMIMAIVFTDTIIPKFNELVGSAISIGQLFAPVPIAILLLGLLLVSLIAGGVPALLMSAYAPVNIVKGTIVKTSKGFGKRELSLVIQFTVTIALIISVTTIFKQLEYMRTANLGMNVHDRVVFGFGIHVYPDKSDVLKNKLLSNPNISYISHVASVPGMGIPLDQERGMPFEIGGKSETLHPALIDEQFLETMDIQLLEGRNLKESQTAFVSWGGPSISEVLVNESAKKLLDIDSIIGKTGTQSLFGDKIRIKVVGVVEDFHYNSLNHNIVPMVLAFAEPMRFAMIAKINSQNRQETLDFIRSSVSEITEIPTKIRFLENIYADQYQPDEAFADLISYLTTIAIIIAIMGLFGVSMHAIKIRIKEIGIRKTMGASSRQILVLLISAFTKVIIISLIIAIPIGWIVMDVWLDNYAFRIDMDVSILILASVISISIALGTIFWQSWRASNLNPARLIRYE